MDTILNFYYYANKTNIEPGCTESKKIQYLLLSGT